MIFNYSFAYNHTNNFSGNQTVAVVANFAVDGRFMPIYFRFVSDDSSENTYKINGIKYSRDKHDSILFYCLITNEGIQHQVILSFYYKDCLWKLEG